MEPGCYGLITLHRPANVDDLDTLSEISLALREIFRKIPLLFPAHPRTRGCIEQSQLDWGSVRIVDSLGYLDFLGLMARARLVLTDSGGIQEETTMLGVPCVTTRRNTERPITIERGTNRLGGVTKQNIVSAARDALTQNGFKAMPPPLWDGHAAPRIVDVLKQWLGG